MCLMMTRRGHCRLEHHQNPTQVGMVEEEPSPRGVSPFHQHLNNNTPCYICALVHSIKWTVLLGLVHHYFTKTLLINVLFFWLIIQAFLTVVCEGPLVLQDSALVDQSLFIHRNTHWRRNVLLELLHSQLHKTGNNFLDYYQIEYGVSKSQGAFTWAVTV